MLFLNKKGKKYKIILSMFKKEWCKVKVYNREVKDLLTKSKLPDADYVINPYIGCTHNCIYCYAEFMSRFAHCSEKWGNYIIVKDSIKGIKCKDMEQKTILISSVTDPYNHIERKYRKTRSVLEQLIDSEATIEILTKSKNVLDDIELIKKIKNIKIGISINTTDDKFREKIEPCASSVDERINTLKVLHENNIKTYAFISPIFPEITDCREIIDKVKNYVDYICFENLNLRGNYKKVVLDFIKINYPDLIDLYNNIYLKKNLSYWEDYKKDLNNYLESLELDYRYYFYHDKIKKK
ncbi:MAG: radical SAM protein [Clostridium sp.]|nr:radical SAM protein [Clostridium sp.]